MLLPLLLLLACGDKDATDDTATSGGDDSGAPAVDADGDGYDSTVDCDDDEFLVNPGANELCNGIDDDCDGLIDDADELHPGQGDRWYPDLDEDGFGDDAGVVLTCEQPEGMVDQGDDCDDSNADVHPDAQEVCNGIDDDCDDQVDDDDSSLDLGTRTAFHEDGDGDGYGDDGVVGVACEAPSDSWVADGTDCDDDNPDINPGAAEVCNDIDDDCDDLIDQDDDSLDPTSTPTIYDDRDEDGYGGEDSARQVCTVPDGALEVGGDCDDDDPLVNPMASEVCNGIDDDCDDLLDEEDDTLDESTLQSWYVDADEDGYGEAGSAATVACDPGDGWATEEGDCDDAEPAINPGATEICNDGIDDDCDRLEDTEDDSLDLDSATAWYPDEDEDGFGDSSADADWRCTTPVGDYASNGLDCDDEDDEINPDAPEVCNGIDDDCDGSLPSDEEDDRGDGWPDCMGAAVEVGSFDATRSEYAHLFGNVLEVDEDAVLRSFRTRLDREAECTVDMYVGSTDSLDETVTPTVEWALSSTMDEGEGYIDSGDLDLDLESGRIYYLLVGFACPEGPATFGLDDDEAWSGADAVVGSLEGWVVTPIYDDFYKDTLPEMSAFNGAVDQILFVE